MSDLYLVVDIYECSHCKRQWEDKPDLKYCSRCGSEIESVLFSKPVEKPVANKAYNRAWAIKSLGGES